MPTCSVKEGGMAERRSTEAEMEAAVETGDRRRSGRTR